MINSVSDTVYHLIFTVGLAVALTLDKWRTRRRALA